MEPTSITNDNNDNDSNSNSNNDYESMSVKELRRLLTQRGFDCSVCLEKTELVEAARRLDATDFDDEAHRLFRQLNLKPTLADRYENLNAIWKHNNNDSTSGGGTVYVGNAVAAGDRATLDERNICAIINCQGNQSQNFFEDDAKFTYHRFVVTTLSTRVCLQHYRKNRTGVAVAAAQPALQGGFQDVFDFIQGHIERGNSVLIHCLAGAHRAGAVGTAWIMYKTGMDVNSALALAQKCRPIISPFGLLLEVLHHLEKELQTTSSKSAT